MNEDCKHGVVGVGEVVEVLVAIHIELSVSNRNVRSTHVKLKGHLEHQPFKKINFHTSN